MHTVIVINNNLQTFKESGDAYAHIDAKHTRRGENDWDEVEDVMGDVELEVAEDARIDQNRPGAQLQNGVGPAALHNEEQEPVDPERLQVMQIPLEIICTAGMRL